MFISSGFLVMSFLILLRLWCVKLMMVFILLVGSGGGLGGLMGIGFVGFVMGVGVDCVEVEERMLVLRMVVVVRL